MDFLALHYYGECTGEAFDSYIKGWADAYRMPIWVTEFSCYKGTTEDNMKFMQEALPSIVNASQYLERYAWFATRTSTMKGSYDGCSLFDEQGTTTPLGHFYAGLPPVLPRNSL